MIAVCGKTIRITTGYRYRRLPVSSSSKTFRALMNIKRKRLKMTYIKLFMEATLLPSKKESMLAVVYITNKFGKSLSFANFGINNDEGRLCLELSSIKLRAILSSSPGQTYICMHGNQEHIATATAHPMGQENPCFSFIRSCSTVHGNVATYSRYLDQL